jgi:hypothetical protein
MHFKSSSSREAPRVEGNKEAHVGFICGPIPSIQSSSRITSWQITFAQKYRGNSNYFHDGILVIRHDWRRILLLDELELVIDSRFLREGEMIQVGAPFEFPIFSARISVTPLSLASLFPNDRMMHHVVVVGSAVAMRPNKGVRVIPVIT